MSDSVNHTVSRHRGQLPRRAAAGFSLVELVMVIVIGGVMATTLLVFFKPALEGYLATRARADLTAQADRAVRRIVRDVRLAVPNSIRTPDAQCVEMVPSSTGGRMRNGPDTVNDSGPSCTPSATCAAPFDTGQAMTVFDVLTPLIDLPQPGDWVVVGNQNPSQVYSGANRAVISSVTTPAVTQGRHRITIPSTQFPIGYDGARFTVVPAEQGPVFYVCSGADGTLNAQGDGKGTLYRLMNYGFNATYPSACPATSGGDVLATRVRSCSFVYDPNQGATQQNGFVWMEIELAHLNEAAHLVMGAHIANSP